MRASRLAPFANDAQGPRVVLHLASGRDIEGVIAHLDGESVVLRARSLTFVPLGAIEAFSLPDEPRHLDRLLERPEELPPVTRLAARRAIVEHERAAARVLDRALVWEIDGLEDTHDLRARIDTSAKTSLAIVAAARDALGKDALASGLERVRIAPGTDPVKREGATLSISFEHGLSVNDLQAAIEAAF